MICGACFPRRLDLPWAHDRGTVEGTGWLRTPLSPQQKKLSPWTMGTPLSQPHLLPVPQNRTARVVYLVGLPPAEWHRTGSGRGGRESAGCFLSLPCRRLRSPLLAFPSRGRSPCSLSLCLPACPAPDPLLEPSRHQLSCPTCNCVHPSYVGVEATLLGLLGERNCGRSQSKTSSGRRWNLPPRGCIEREKLKHLAL